MLSTLPILSEPPPTATIERSAPPPSSNSFRDALRDAARPTKQESPAVSDRPLDRTPEHDDDVADPPDAPAATDDVADPPEAPAATEDAAASPPDRDAAANGSDTGDNAIDASGDSGGETSSGADSHADRSDAVTGSTTPSAPVVAPETSVSVTVGSRASAAHGAPDATSSSIEQDAQAVKADPGSVRIDQPRDQPANGEASGSTPVDREATTASTPDATFASVETTTRRSLQANPATITPTPSRSSGGANGTVEIAPPIEDADRETRKPLRRSDHRQASDRPSSPAAAQAASSVDRAVRLENQTGLSPVSTGTAAVDTPATGIGGLAAMAGGAGAPGGSGSGLELLAGEPRDAQRPDESPRFTARIVRSLSALVNQRGGVMNMRLDPPELGQLRIQMNLGRGVVSAEFHASTAPARVLLEKHMASLRTALEGQGLSVERLAVHVAAGQGTGAAGAEGEQQSGSEPRADRDAADGESRGRGEDSRQETGRSLHTSFEELVSEARSDEGESDSTMETN